jgi:hypothetical protein
MSASKQQTVCLTRVRHAGVVDMGSNSSVGNWAAARDLDVTTLVMRGATRYPPETGRLRPLFKACFDTVQVSLHYCL